MNYKKGDKVRVREDSEDGKNDFVENMEKFKGKIVTIDYVSKSYKCYKIKEDNNIFYWTDEMLEPVEYSYEDLYNAPLRNEDNI